MRLSVGNDGGVTFEFKWDKGRHLPRLSWKRAGGDRKMLRKAQSFPGGEKRSSSSDLDLAQSLYQHTRAGTTITEFNQDVTGLPDPTAQMFPFELDAVECQIKAELEASSPGDLLIELPSSVIRPFHLSPLPQFVSARATWVSGEHIGEHIRDYIDEYAPTCHWYEASSINPINLATSSELQMAGPCVYNLPPHASYSKQQQQILCTKELFGELDTTTLFEDGETGETSVPYNPSLEQPSIQPFLQSTPQDSNTLSVLSSLQPSTLCRAFTSLAELDSSRTESNCATHFSDRNLKDPILSVAVKRSTSTPLAMPMLWNGFLSAAPKRSISAHPSSAQTYEQLTDQHDTHLPLNGVSVYYNTENGQSFFDMDSRGIRPDIRGFSVRTSSMSMSRSKSIQPIQSTGSFSLRINYSYNTGFPFASIVRSTSLESPSFSESVKNLHQIRYELCIKDRPRQRFRGGKLSVSARGSLMHRAYPPVRCKECVQTFTGQYRRRALVRHRKLCHSHSCRSARGSRRVSQKSGRIFRHCSNASITSNSSIMPDIEISA